MMKLSQEEVKKLAREELGYYAMYQTGAWYGYNLAKDEISEANYALEKVLENRANDSSFAISQAESEERERIKNEVSEMIYNTIPTGEITAFDLIKILKQLKQM